MTFNSYSAPSGVGQSFKFNGKEREELTGWDDYGARMYMSDLGRWGVVDPVADIYLGFSPYNFTLNNPIKYIDPNGMWVEGANGYSTNDPDEMRDFLRQLEQQQQRKEQKEEYKKKTKTIDHNNCCPQNREEKNSNYQLSTSISIGAQAGFNINNVLKADLNLASTPLLKLESGRNSLIDYPLKYRNSLTIDQSAGVSVVGFGVSGANNFLGDLTGGYSGLNQTATLYGPPIAPPFTTNFVERKKMENGPSTTESGMVFNMSVSFIVKFDFSLKIFY
ncbi:RHS repeat-associated core domain-containing protein [Belliella kenyensis]|uniref:RHS repeat-associated core domain-containing protein n=1 Tax=Belliella kenyensis TaxID=1472724 RepID=A0ABV8ELE5_9BACT|nr:RHS repeat-associated core domain-containing protein [Belliella kenyensis]MCH7403867.1 RHS repeat-associated core domain-containing protein [Belliella kenyensis]MDN3604872.1 RHS repeat-associated core domain-containing protein [Belliella kenyensis]